MDSREPSIEDVLGPLGAQIMRVVWEQGSATVASVTEVLRQRRTPPPAYTTVMTVMGRLHDRGLLTRTRQGRQFVYQATDHENAIIDRLGRDAIDDVIGRFGTAAYRQFALRLAEVDPALRARLEAVAAESEE